MYHYHVVCISIITHSREARVPVGELEKESGEFLGDFDYEGKVRKGKVRLEVFPKGKAPVLKQFIFQLQDCSVVRDLQIIAGVRIGCSFGAQRYELQISKRVFACLAKYLNLSCFFKSEVQLTS